jgi:DNA-binding MarR family transcriptional regulator
MIRFFTMKVRSHRASPASSQASREQDAADVVKSLRQLFKAIQEYSKAILKRTGLSAPQVWALTVLQRESGLSLGELAERLFAHPSTISVVIDRLEERGAVRREVDPEDRRGIRLSLTAVGRRLLRESPPPVQLGLRQALESMPATRLRQLRRSLGEVVRETVARRIEAPFFDVNEADSARRPPRRGRRSRS